MTKPQGGLGRGLGSLIPQAPQTPSIPLPSQPVSAPQLTPPEPVIEIADGELKIHNVSPNDIVANPYQPRKEFATEALEELMASIKEHGIMQPLTVTKLENGKYELIAGERRLRASRALGLSDVPVIVREADRKQKLELALIENIQRQDLNPVEEAIAYRQLVTEFNLTQDAVAARVGKSRPQVANTLRLLDLQDDMLEALSAGQITRSHARTLLAEESPTRRQELFAKMLTGGVTVRNAEETVRAHTRKPRHAKDPNIAEIEKTLREKMGTKVEINMNGAASGTVVVHFYSKDDLRALIEHLS